MQAIMEKINARYPSGRFYLEWVGTGWNIWDTYCGLTAKGFVTVNGEFEDMA